MGKSRMTLFAALAVTVGLMAIPGCSKKAVQSGGDTQSAQGKTGGGSLGDGATLGSSGSMGSADSGPAGSHSGIGTFPDTSMQSGGGGLKGLDKNPSEERVVAAGGGGTEGGGGNETGGGSAGSGTMLAKADPSDVTRQMDEIRAEQAASTAAGLRDVYFSYDSWTISEEGRQALGRNADWLKSNPGAAIKVEGHCDERGTSAYNLVLGEKRAKAVRNYLVELGVAANRLSVVSYGKERPFCSDHAEACYQQNRRGHLVVRTGK
ncbi:Peptidoglycan-associated lipoprotein [Nitrospira sp. KM1]|uniref:peptidoglycan-associated lipoprotein Pal n=1 Tax=Nitrospira sp. KM1 TaxID=1936990 RepID=UPI0013A78B8B|nr:peptidoglycan-associated lipoprotein Pal [Nitrospira sp. KM1]BCA54407.1 Peptidoglycan-associated lipoprotein [Nitrospira sp. KM1]